MEHPLLQSPPAPKAWRPAALTAPVVVRKLWRGRSRATALYVSLQTSGGENVAEVRVWRLDGAGCMQPAEGITVDIHRCPELVAAHCRAVELALIGQGHALS